MQAKFKVTAVSRTPNTNADKDTNPFIYSANLSLVQDAKETLGMAAAGNNSGIFTLAASLHQCS